MLARISRWPHYIVTTYFLLVIGRNQGSQRITHCNPIQCNVQSILELHVHWLTCQIPQTKEEKEEARAGRPFTRPSPDLFVLREFSNCLSLCCQPCNQFVHSTLAPVLERLTGTCHSSVGLPSALFFIFFMQAVPGCFSRNKHHARSKSLHSSFARWRQCPGELTCTEPCVLSPEATRSRTP